jgi:hypothetical protein
MARTTVCTEYQTANIAHLKASFAQQKDKRFRKLSVHQIEVDGMRPHSYEQKGLRNFARCQSGTFPKAERAANNQLSKTSTLLELNEVKALRNSVQQTQKQKEMNVRTAGLLCPVENPS